MIFVGSNDIRTGNGTPEVTADQVVKHIFNLVEALWVVVHPSTRIYIVDIWKRKLVSEAWDKTATLIKSRLHHLKVDDANRINKNDLLDNVHLNDKGYAKVMQTMF